MIYFIRLFIGLFVLFQYSNLVWAAAGAVAGANGGSVHGQQPPTATPTPPNSDGGSSPAPAEQKSAWQKAFPNQPNPKPEELIKFIEQAKLNSSGQTLKLDELGVPEGQKEGFQKLINALDKKPKELVEFWKTNRANMGTAEGKVMRAVLDKRMSDFPMLKEIQGKSGEALELLYGRLNELQDKMKGALPFKDVTKRAEIFDGLNHLISSTSDRTELLKVVSSRLDKLGQESPKGPVKPEAEAQKKMLLGIQLALQVDQERRKNGGGLSLEASKTIERHPFFEGGGMNLTGSKFLGEFEQSKNNDQARIDKYWDAVNVVNTRKASTQLSVGQANDILKSYGDTSDWHIQQSKFSNGKDEKFFNGFLGNAKANGLVTEDGMLVSAMSRQLGGPSLGGGSLVPRDSSLVYQLIDTKQPEVLTAYFKAYQADVQGGSRHPQEAVKLKQEIEGVMGTKNTTQFEQGFQAFAWGKIGMPVGQNDPDTNTEVAKVQNSFKVAKVQNGQLAWADFSFDTIQRPKNK